MNHDEINTILEVFTNDERKQLIDILEKKFDYWKVSMQQCVLMDGILKDFRQVFLKLALGLAENVWEYLFMVPENFNETILQIHTIRAILRGVIPFGVCPPYTGVSALYAIVPKHACHRISEAVNLAGYISFVIYFDQKYIPRIPITYVNNENPVINYSTDVDITNFIYSVQNETSPEIWSKLFNDFRIVVMIDKPSESETKLFKTFVEDIIKDQNFSNCWSSN